MKYLLSWAERTGGSTADLEASQRRTLELFRAWQPPSGVIFEQFLVRVGEFGGAAVISTDDLAALHEATTIFAGLAFKTEPVLDIMDAVAAESRGVAWRETAG
jgi:hypothetical protein